MAVGGGCSTLRWRCPQSTRTHFPSCSVLTETNVQGDAICFMVKPWAIQDHRNSWRRLAVGGWQPLAGGGWWSLGALVRGCP